MLKKYMKENNLKPTELAERMHLSISTTYRILNGKNVGPRSIKAVAKLLNKEVLEVYAYYKQS